ncbi:MAG: acyl-ACP--UDP-N-acetylglucosamine O-acyltransferase [Candidatus Omnitrophica bacterium]|nr:acyl-ACP--UDP-N-acetylglucosamine O-acyltransferase [Candidatus Omnitrophota bacterium]
MSIETHKTKTFIHPTAIIDPEAELGAGVRVGPYSIIEANVTVGDGTTIGARVTVEGHTTLGKENQVFTGAVIGSMTQDKKYKGGVTYLKIGDRNKIREYVTVNPGTEENSETVIGNDNLIMAYAHVAHNCIIGNNTIIANAGTLAGHVVVEDRAVIGGLSGVHQFVRIGYLSIMGGNSKAVQDIPPYVMVDGHPAKAYGLNVVGMERAGVSQEERMLLKRAFKIIFRYRLSTKNAIQILKNELQQSPAIQRSIKFLENSERGICK